MFKKSALLLAVINLVVAAYAQTATVITDFSTGAVMGLAAPAQASSSAEPGFYTDKKNAFFLNGNLLFTASDIVLYDLGVKFNIKSRVGSPYLPLQSAYASASENSLSLDSAWARLNVTNSFDLDLPLEVKVRVGKYSTSARDLSISRYKLEQVQSMVKTANTGAMGFDATWTMELQDDPKAPSTIIQLEAVTAGLLDESVQRLYDTDGGISTHGQPILDEYAPQAMGALRLSSLPLGPGLLGLALEYAYNGASIYSGHSAGFGSQYILTLATPPEPAEGELAALGPVITLPISLSAAWYEKNIDALAGTTGDATQTSYDTSDFRSTLRAGMALGLKYVDPDILDMDLSLSGSFNAVGHIYRDPLTLINLGLDGEVKFNSVVHAGFGAVLGSLLPATWKTSPGVSTADDDFQRTYDLVGNLGYEIYAGLNATKALTISLGYFDYAGLTMTQGLKRPKDGATKFLQAGTTEAEGLYKTGGLYLIASFKK